MSVAVPAGFITDFASVPRCLHWLIKPSDLGKAAVIHDWLYKKGLVSKRVADAIFHEAMVISGIPGWKRLLAFKAVVWFGHRAWKAHRLDKQEERR